MPKEFNAIFFMNNYPYIPFFEISPGKNEVWLDWKKPIKGDETNLKILHQLIEDGIILKNELENNIDEKNALIQEIGNIMRNFTEIYGKNYYFKIFRIY